MLLGLEPHKNYQLSKDLTMGHSQAAPDTPRTFEPLQGIEGPANLLTSVFGDADGPCRPPLGHVLLKLPRTPMNLALLDLHARICWYSSKAPKL